MLDDLNSRINDTNDRTKRFRVFIYDSESSTGRSDAKNSRAIRKWNHNVYLGFIIVKNSGGANHAMVGYDVGSPYSWWLRIDYYAVNSLIWYQSTHVSESSPKITKYVIAASSSSVITY